MEGRSGTTRYTKIQRYGTDAVVPLDVLFKRLAYQPAVLLIKSITQLSKAIVPLTL